MDARERAAAAHAAGGAVARVTKAVAGTHEVVAGAVRARLAPLGAAGQLPLDASTTMARANYAAVQSAARGAATLAAPLLAERTPPDATPAAGQLPAAAWLAALGAAFGDQMVDDHRVRALTVPMSLRDNGALLLLEQQDGAALLENPSPALVIFVHGLGNHEAVWGEAYLDVAREHAATPLTLRYTTGQAIVDSGAELADLLDGLVSTWPVPVERIVLVGHSMGGLVIRAGLAAGGPWRGLVCDVITLGTPHAGAPLERFAARSLALAGTVPVIAPIVALGDERSVGIKDLGFAEVAAPTAGPDWHLVAATLAQPNATSVLGRARSEVLGTLGDGLVTIDSAFAVEAHLTARRLVIGDASHMALLGHPDAVDVLRSVLSKPR